MLCNDFREHSTKDVKEFTTSLDFLCWKIMAGGITPVGQPLDKLVNKVFKGYFHDIFDKWSLTAPINAKNGIPKTPSRQLLATWVVEAWDKVPETLCKKAWEVCGYKPEHDTDATNTSTDIVENTEDDLGKF